MYGKGKDNLIVTYSIQSKDSSDDEASLLIPLVSPNTNLIQSKI